MHSPRTIKPKIEGCIFPEHFDWNAPFGEVHLEIGAGVGLHAIQWAKKNPQILTIAVERTTEKYQKFKRRLERHPKLLEQKNIVAIHGDALSWCEHELNRMQWDRVFLLYPNPEPKNPKARFVSLAGFKIVLSQMKTEAVLEVATNEAFYADEFSKLAVDSLGLKQSASAHFNIENAPLGFKPRTHFEKKYFERKQTLHQMQFVRA